jgi:molecular chaperone Hsp33
MVQKDSGQRFHFEALGIRGEYVRLDQTWAALCALHPYPSAAAALLGEALAAAALLSGTLKYPGTLTLQAAGDGALRAVMAEVRETRALRGIVRFRDDDAALPEIAAPLKHLGEGLLTLTLRPPKGEPHQGIVRLGGDHLADAVERYFEQSEQLPTRLWLSTTHGVQGLLLQALPGGDCGSEGFERLAIMANTVKDQELAELDAQTLLKRLFPEDDIRLHPPRPLAFECTCSRERTQETLAAMAPDTLEEILREDGEILMTCQFCQARYRFDPIDFALLNQSSAPKASGPH